MIHDRPPDRLWRSLRSSVGAVLLLGPLLAGPGRASDDADSLAPPTPVVRGIEIRTQNVFSTRETRRGFVPYGMLNALHRKTRTGFIRKSLSVHAGDSAASADLAECERNLRGLRLFRHVAVTADSGRVLVETADAWSTEPRIGLSRGGGRTSQMAAFEEWNLLGTGRHLQLAYNDDDEAISRSFTLGDPGASLPHVYLSLTGADQSNGWRWEGGLERPFDSFDTPRAGSVSFRASNLTITRYAGGEPAQRWRESKRFATVTSGMRLSRSATSVWRAGGTGQWEDTQIRSAGLGAIPADSSRRYLFLSLDLERQGRHWIVRRNVDEIDRDEDFELSPAGRLEVGASPPLFGARRAAAARLTLSDGVALGSGFALLSASAESRREAEWRQTLLSGEVRAYTMAIPATTLVGRVAAVSGWRLDPGEVVTLDGDTGVRAYRLHAATGTSRLVANLEARTRVATDVLHLVSLGTAVFWDGGVVEGPPDGHVRLADAGLGLRLGLSRASRRTLVRFDLARALLPDPQGRREWMLSFATGQAF